MVDVRLWRGVCVPVGVYVRVGAGYWARRGAARRPTKGESKAGPKKQDLVFSGWANSAVGGRARRASTRSVHASDDSCPHQPRDIQTGTARTALALSRSVLSCKSHPGLARGLVETALDCTGGVGPPGLARGLVERRP